MYSHVHVCALVCECVGYWGVAGDDARGQQLLMFDFIQSKLTDDAKSFHSIKFRLRQRHQRQARKKHNTITLDYKLIDVPISHYFLYVYRSLWESQGVFESTLSKLLL